jgi:hypothetical protein
MSDFPQLKTGAVMQYPASKTLRHAARVMRFLDGAEQRYREYSSAMRRWVVRLDLLDEEELARLQQFFSEVRGQAGEFSFQDPWDGTVYPSCSLENDELAVELAGEMRGSTLVIVRENRN